MPLTPSTMLPLGTRAPEFELPDTVSGRSLALAQLRGPRATVLMFLCNHCPYVIHVNPELVRVARDYRERGVAFIAISSNDAHDYPEDGPEHMRARALHLGYPFPYLYDESQAVARACRAACTPDFFLFDGQLELAYRGRLDDSTPSNRQPITGADLRAALDAILAGEKPASDQRPSMGCNIKWKR